MKSKKSIFRNIILMLSLIILVFVLVNNFGDINKIVETLKTADWKWIIGAMFMFALYLILWPLSLHVIAKSESRDIKFSFIDSYCIGASEFFFNNVTPFATGGQPFQVYCYNEIGIKPSRSTSTLIMNFLIYQIILNIYSILALILYFNKIIDSINSSIPFIEGLPINVLIIIGFSVNMFMLGFVILVATSKMTENFLVWCMKMVAKIKIFRKHVEPKIDSFKKYVENTQIAFKESFRKWKTILLSFTIKFVALGVFYSIPFFCFKTLGIDMGLKDVFYIIAVTSFALTIFIWLPTPGSIGGVELAFSVLFMALPGVIDSNIPLTGMLIWRFITYYLLLIYGFFAYIVFEKRRKKYENRNIQ